MFKTIKQVSVITFTLQVFPAWEKANEGAKQLPGYATSYTLKLSRANMLTIYPIPELYKEIQKGNWREEAEL